MPRPKFDRNVITIIPRREHGPLIEVTWLMPLEWAGRLNDFYAETFDTPAGVEHVAVGRYSAWIEVAPHIATVAEVVDVLYDLLTSPEAQAVLAGHFPDGYQVQTLVV